MEYISHSDYTKMLSNFGKETPKGMLKEAIENEGNAFTAALAKTPKGGKFKVDGEVIKDKSNYDAPVKENEDALRGILDNLAARLKGQSLPYEKLEQIAAALQNQKYQVNARFLQDFLKNHGVSVQEGTESAPHTALDIAMRMQKQGYDIDAIEALLMKKGMSAESIEDALEAISKVKTREGLNLPSPGMKATGQTIAANEGDQLNRFSTLSPPERDQLKSNIEALKTIKQEIAKLLEKAKPAAKMESQMGGDRTKNMMMHTGVAEADDDKERMSDEEAEEMTNKHEKEKKDKEDYEASIR